MAMVKTLDNASLEELAQEFLFKITRGIISELQDEIRKEVQRQLAPMMQDETSSYITRKEAADALDVSLVTIHQLMNNGTIPFVKVGRSTRIPKKEFEEAISKQYKKYKHKNR